MNGEIWIVNLPSSDGHEQTGSRPVILIEQLEANIAIVIPITSNLNALRFPHTIELQPTKTNGLSQVSILLAFQIRAIDEKRLVNRIGKLEPNQLSALNKMLKKMLKL